MKLQFCVSGSFHCDELPRSVLRKLSSLEPGRELFGLVWILEDVSGRCSMLACSVLRLLCKRRSPRRRRGVIKRSELRAWRFAKWSS